MKEGFHFAWDLFLQNSSEFFLYFQLALVHSVSYSFYPINHHRFHCAMFLMLVLLTLMGFYQIYPKNYFSLQTLTSIIRTGNVA